MTTEKLIELFDMIIEHELYEKVEILLTPKQIEFFNYYCLFNDIKPRKTKTIKTPRLSKFCSQFMYSLESTRTISTQKKLYILMGELKFKIISNTEITYQNNSIKVELYYDKLNLIINNRDTYFWKIDEIVKRSGLTESVVIDKIKNNKIEIVFNYYNNKDHGTTFKIMN